MTNLFEMLYIRAWVYKVNLCLKDEYLKIFRVLNNDGKVLQMRLKKNDIFLGKSLEVLIKSDIDQRFDPSIYFIRNLTWACASALKGQKLPLCIYRLQRYTSPAIVNYFVISTATATLHLKIQL